MNTIGDSSNVMISKPIFNRDFVDKVKKIDYSKKKLAIDNNRVKTKEVVEQFDEVLEVANEVFFGSEFHYEFQVHEKTGSFMSKLVNTETGETIREIPSEKILDMIAGLWEIAGVIIDDHA
jgi:flagellar protein FlaG